MYISMRDLIHQVALQRIFTKGLRFNKNVNCRLNMSDIFCPRAGIVGPSTRVIYDKCQKFLKLRMPCVGPKMIFSIKVNIIPMLLTCPVCHRDNMLL